MGLFQFLIIVQGIVAAALVGIILMQRSEGGGLGVGGSPSGMMSARGAADFMTRTTTILATLFVALSIGLAFVSAKNNGGSELDTSLERTEAEVVVPNTEGAAPEGEAGAPATPATEQTPAESSTEVPTE